MKTTFEFYADSAGRHRWRRTTGKEVVESQQGYSYPSEAIDNARRHGYELPTEEPEATNEATPTSKATRSSKKK